MDIITFDVPGDPDEWPALDDEWPPLTPEDWDKTEN